MLKFITLILIISVGYIFLISINLFLFVIIYQENVNDSTIGAKRRPSIGPGVFLGIWITALCATDVRAMGVLVCYLEAGRT